MVLRPLEPPLERPPTDHPPGEKHQEVLNGVRADVPIAVWAFDTDRDASTGVDAGPAAAGVTSPGLEEALVVSSRGAWLHDLRSGEVVDVTERGGRMSVDEDARSFVVRVPEQLLPVRGSWRVRLAAGLADETARRTRATR